MPNKKEDDREQQIDAATLGRFTKTQLLRLAEGIGVGADIAISASRTEIVVIILRAAGHKLRKPPPPTPSQAKTITLEQLDYLLQTYLQDEVMLLKASASVLGDLLLLRNLSTPLDPKGQPISVPYSVLKERLERTLSELRFYTGHSNIKAIANLYRIVNPEAKLDL